MDNAWFRPYAAARHRAFQSGSRPEQMMRRNSVDGPHSVSYADVSTAGSPAPPRLCRQQREPCVVRRSRVPASTGPLRRRQNALRVNLAFELGLQCITCCSGRRRTVAGLRPSTVRSNSGDQRSSRCRGVARHGRDTDADAESGRGRQIERPVAGPRERSVCSAVPWLFCGHGRARAIRSTRGRHRRRRTSATCADVRAGRRVPRVGGPPVPVRRRRRLRIGRPSLETSSRSGA
jgi:hypothetical protein